MKMEPVIHPPIKVLNFPFYANIYSTFHKHNMDWNKIAKTAI